ncbi:MAG: CoA-binding protein, partial [Chloroflexota bacterium]|nr:CoA-binding protein [Chloroflexota bacterium]
MEFIKYLFDSDSVAVIGASNTPGTWGFGVMNTLFSSSKKRKIWPVTKSASEVLGIKAYRSIIEVPEEIDFAVISVPASEVPGVMRQCVEKEVKSALIISAGLAESGEEGARIEEEVVQIARLGGLRFIGPNSMGHADTFSDFSTLAWLREIKKGPIGFISQSGTYGERLVNTALAAGLGFSKFISSGNEANLHLEDYLEYLAQDEDTQIIALYVEGLREGRRFLHLAKEITRKKPIVVLKSGRTEGSARAA